MVTNQLLDVLTRARASARAVAVEVEQMRDAAETLDAAYALLQSVYQDESVPAMLGDVERARAILAQPAGERGAEILTALDDVSATLRYLWTRLSLIDTEASVMAIEADERLVLARAAQRGAVEPHKNDATS